MTKNHVSLIGRIGNDPEIRQTSDGRPIANFSVATSERWKDRDSGERKERTEWHRCVCFTEATAKFIEQYVHKGDLVAVEGMIQTRKWEDQDGNERYSTEIVIKNYGHGLEKLGEPGGGSDKRPTEPEGAPPAGSSRPGMNRGGSSSAAPDDDIPF